MTTAPPGTDRPTPDLRVRDSGVRVLAGAGVAAAVIGAMCCLVGWLVSGSSAAYGALIGTVLVIAVLGFGAVVVNTVAGVLPTAALLVAVLTYGLQVVLMGLVFVALSGSGLLEERVDRAWIAIAVIGGTAAWLVSQVLLATRARIPVYDLPEGGAR